MKKQRSQPYQPLLLRILHGVTGLSAIIAIITAFWTYNTYDGRWFKIPLPDFEEIESIHGTFGLYTLLIFPLFVIYAFHRGQKRLIQPHFLDNLRQIGKPIWWYNLHRLINTLTLLAVTFAVFSGKMMDEKWLPNGELNHLWYYLHLISWGILVICLLFHLLMTAKVGGIPLFLSMLNWYFSTEDSPRNWSKYISNFRHNWRRILSQEWLKLSFYFQILESTILVSIISAWIISISKYSATN
jgi:hypothetical protein